MITHLRKLDVLSSAEETKIKEAAGQQDQISMFINIVTSKDPQGSDVLLNFLESSESQVAQLIRYHGKGADVGFAVKKSRHLIYQGVYPQTTTNEPCCVHV